MRIRKFILASCLTIMALSAAHAEDTNIEPLWTPEKSAAAEFRNTILFNRWHSGEGWSVLETLPTLKIARPVAEYEKAKYLIFSGTTSFDSRKIKQTLLKYLPNDVKAIVYVQNEYEISEVQQKFGGIIPNDRLKIVVINKSGNGFWARDTIPVPVLMAQGSTKLGITGARYYHSFEPDALIAGIFKVPWQEHDFSFEGGNFLADSKGNCWLVDNNRAAKIPDDIFKRFYACATVNRLPHLKGIGHIDESVKFISDTVAVTDTPDYVSRLEEKGFTVKMLPRPDREIETYTNSLLINGTIYVPIFGEVNDDAAAKVYSDLGLNVIKVNSKLLSNDGMGSIHCITMTYPAEN